MTQRQTWIVASVLVAGMLLACGAKPSVTGTGTGTSGSTTQPSGKDDISALLGEWSVETATWNGDQGPGKPTEKVSFTKDQATVTLSDFTMNGTYSLDTTTTPKRITFSKLQPPHVLKSCAGIYEVNGDTLKLAFTTPYDADGQGRYPTEFVPRQRDGTTILTCKRKK